jgi:hypothetical protein
MDTPGAVGGHASKHAVTTNNLPPKSIVSNANKLQPRPGPSSSKKANVKRPPKGSQDPVSLYNRFGSLEDMDLELNRSPGKGVAKSATKTNLQNNG